LDASFQLQSILLQGTQLALNADLLCLKELTRKNIDLADDDIGNQLQKLVVLEDTIFIVVNVCL
jgi:hypothetical protein